MLTPGRVLLRSFAFLFFISICLCDAQTALRFVATTPCRVVDTRRSNGPFGGPAIQGGTERDFALPQGACGIPNTAAAYSLNVTAVPQHTLNYLTIWPTGQSMPVVSTLNSYDGRVKANAVIVPAGESEAVSVYVTDTTNVILDVDGYFVPATGDGLELFSLTPCRVADTRGPDGPLGGPYMTGNSTRNFPVLSASSCNIPSSAQAYSLNITVVPRNGHPLNYLTVWPTGESQPVVSTLNAPTGTTTANAAIIESGTNGEIEVYVTDDTDVIIDIDGYLAPPSGSNGLTLYTLNPCRTLDTRQTIGAFQGTLPIDIVDSACGVPSVAQAYVLNATVVPTRTLGYLTLWPHGEQQPVVSTLNAVDGAVTSNMAIVPTQDGWIDAYTSDSSNLILDITSYFGPITPTITTTSLPAGVLRQPYNATLQAVGGFPPYLWMVSSGSLPAGLTLNSNGTITGTPTAKGVSSFTVQATDSQQQVAAANLAITVQQALPLQITTYSLPTGTVGAPYDATLTATGGVPPYTWTVISGSLPAGLSLNSNGEITGTPTATGNSNFTVQVTDFESPPQVTTGQLSISIQPNAPPVLTGLSRSSGPLYGTDLTIYLYGSGFTTGSVAQWNGAPLTTVYGSPEQLQATIPAMDFQALGNSFVTVDNPGQGGGESASQAFTVYLPLLANDLIYNSTTQLLYASIPSAAGPQLGNSVVSIDPVTGALGTPIWVGSEPDVLGLSSDGSTLWVGLEGAAAVRAVNLQTQTAGVQFSLGGGVGEYDAPNTAVAIAVMPGNPNTVAVAYSNQGTWWDGGVAVYDNGVMRAQGNSTLLSAISFSPSGSELYGAGSEYGSGYWILTVGSSGITAATEKNSNVGGNVLRYVNGNVYLSDGAVLNAESGALLGTFYVTQSQAASGPIAVDSTIGRAWIVESNFTSAPAIPTFDISTYVLDGNIPLGIGQSPSTLSLTRWGQDGLAFLNKPGEVYILQSTLVRDLSHTLADMSITANGPASGQTGANLAYNLTITNGGPNTANQVSVTDNIPQGTVFNSATASQGYCSGTYVVQCNLGTIADNGTATVTINVTALNAGAVQNTAQVSAAQGDPNLNNNTVTTSTSISGQPHNPVPSLTSISPVSAQLGSQGLTLTVTGAQFTSTSQIMWNGAALPTTFTSTTQLTAQLSSQLLANAGWALVSVTTPAPGGGVTPPQPFTIFQIISLDTSYIVFDPFTRKLYASIPSTAPQLTGNSIVAIDPVTGAVGTPVNIGSEPTRMAESDDGQWLYIILVGSDSLARYNLITGQRDPTTYPLNPPQGGSPAPRDVAVMPGMDNTLAIDLGSWLGNGIYDISNGSGTFRSQLTGPYSGSSLAFPDASHLYTYDIDTSGSEFYRWNVTSSGLAKIDGSTLFGLGGFTGGYKLVDGLVYGFDGGLANPTPTPPQQLAWYQVGAALGPNQEVGAVSGAPDPAIDRVFFLGLTYEGTSNPALLAFDQAQYVVLGNMLFSGDSAGPNIVRAGQDGLAFQLGDGSQDPPGSGQIVLMHGPFVLPEWMTSNPAPTLSSLHPSSTQAGGGNFYLTAVGGNFVPGAVVLWNGSARTTTYVDAQHVQAAIAAADIASPGTVTVTVQNPGSAPSGGVTFTIN